MNSLQNKAL